MGDERGRRIVAMKVVRCYCGFVAEGEDAELVSSVQVHVREVHRMEYTPEEVLAMAEPAE
jgi:predicted small metal-binding protein